MNLFKRRIINILNDWKTKKLNNDWKTKKGYEITLMDGNHPSENVTIFQYMASGSNGYGACVSCILTCQNKGSCSDFPRTLPSFRTLLTLSFVLLVFFLSYFVDAFVIWNVITTRTSKSNKVRNVLAGITYLLIQI